jgi:hypothetical protein
MTYSTTTYELHQRSDGLWAVAERMIDPGIVAWRVITEYMPREQAEAALEGMKEDKQ